jgi:hypothetical protein
MMAPVIAGWRRAGRSCSDIRLFAGEEGADHRVGGEPAVPRKRHSAAEDQQLAQLRAVGAQHVGAVGEVTPGAKMSSATPGVSMWALALIA